MDKYTKIDLHRLRKDIHYNPITGIFTRARNTSNGYLVGSRLGSLDKYGYLVAEIQGYNCRLHKIAFLYMEGKVPTMVDHIDNNKLNLIWANLRSSDRYQNNHNRKLASNSSSGIKGISWKDNRGCIGYTASIMLKGKRYIKWFPINVYKTKESALEEAKKWLLPLREQLHGEFANHG